MKKPNRKTPFIACALLAMTMISASASASRGNISPFGAIGKLIHMAHRLGLDEQQIAALQGIRQAHLGTHQALGKARRENRRATKALVKSDQASTAQIEVLAQSKGELHAQAFVERFAMRQEIKSVLTADQMEKIKRYRKHKRQAGTRGR